MILTVPKPSLWSESLYGMTSRFLNLYQNGTSLDHTLQVRRLCQKNSHICLEDIDLNYETYLWHAKEQASGWSNPLSQRLHGLILRLTSRLAILEKISFPWVLSSKVLSLYLQLEKQLAHIYQGLMKEESLDHLIYAKLYANGITRQKHLMDLIKSIQEISHLGENEARNLILPKSRQSPWLAHPISLSDLPQTPDLLKTFVHDHRFLDMTQGDPSGPRWFLVHIQTKQELALLGNVFSDIAHPTEFRIVFTPKEMIPLFKKPLMNEWDLHMVTDKPEMVSEFIRKQTHQCEMIGSLKHYALELQKYESESKWDHRAVLLKRLATFQDTLERNRILAHYHRVLENFPRERFYLKKILHRDSTQIWAARRLVGNLIESSQMTQAWQVLTKLHQWNPLDQRRKEILD